MKNIDYYFNRTFLFLSLNPVVYAGELSNEFKRKERADWYLE